MKPIVPVLVFLALAAGGAAYFLFGSSTGSSGLDAAGQSLVQRAEAEAGKDERDSKACRDILLEISKHPAAATNAALLRSRARLELALGRSERALVAIEGVLGPNATAPDIEVAAAVLARRFADSGDTTVGFRAATLAEDHFRLTDAKASAFLAWQMYVRIDDAEHKERRAQAAKVITERFPKSDEAKLVAALKSYPDLREDPSALSTLRELDNAFAVIPAELDLALAFFEVEKPETFDSCMERVERVLKFVPSTILGRTIGGICAVGQKKWGLAVSWFGALLRKHPNHKRVKLWQKLHDLAKSQLEAAKNK